MATCQRPGCENPLKTGKYYCSPKCSAIDRSNKKEEALEFRSQLSDKLGPNHQWALDQIIDVALQGEVPQRFAVPYPIHVGHEDLFLSFDGKKEWRPQDRLDFETIEMMQRSGPVMFAAWMMMSKIMKVFGDGRYVIESPDKELAEIATASFKKIAPKMASDFVYSSMIYGASFQEQLWHYATKYELGLSNSRSAVTPFSVPKSPKSLNPSTIAHINRINNGKTFDGFTQKVRKFDEEEVRIDVGSALVIPHNSRFGNLYGRSMLEPVYPSWVWYEMTMRAMARYVDKEAKPITIARAPSRGSVEISGHSSPVNALDLALVLAGSLAHSNAVAIPSDRDQSGNYQWELGHIVSQDRHQLFIGILEYLAFDMIRASLNADNSVAKSSGGTGSYNIGEVHWRASAIVAEMILINALHYLNEYFFPNYSRFNRGFNGPPIWIKTQPIDQQERDLLLKLIGIAGNSPTGERFFGMVDWREMAETSNVPTISEEEAFDKKEEEFEQGLEHQKKQMEMLAEVKQPSQPGQGAESDPGKQSNDSTTAQLTRFILENKIHTISYRDLDRLGVRFV